MPDEDPSTSTFSSTFTAGNVLGFAAHGSTGTTGTFGSITVGGIIATSDFTLISSGTGTISNNATNGSAVIGINVIDGKTLDFGGESFTTAASAGYIKNGGGVLALTGNTYKSGFTLNAGTVVARANTAFGSGTSGTVNNTLTINGGVLAVAGANRDFSGAFPGGIIVGGNFTLGASTGLALGSANMTFNNAVSLGAADRTVTLGAGTTGVYNFSGGISSTNNAGLTIAGPAVTSGTAGPTFVFGNATNGYTGATNISGGVVQFTSTGTSNSFSKTVINFTGTAELQWTGSQTDDLSARIGTISPGALATFGVPTSKTVTFGTALSGGGGIATDNAGKLILSKDNLYAGPTSIGDVGTLQVGTGGTAGSLGTDIGTINFTTSNATGGHLVFNRSDTVSIPNNIAGIGNVQQLGSGKLILGGTNSYSGTTTVSAGTLIVNGTNASRTTTVSSGATLGGKGTLAGDVTVAAGAFITGGSGSASNDSVGPLMISGALDVNSGSTYVVKLDGNLVPSSPAPDAIQVGASDELIVSSVSDTSTSISISPMVLATGNFTPGTKYTFLIAHSATGNGTTRGLSNVALPNGFSNASGSFAVRDVAENGGDDWLLDYTPITATPEPGTISLLALSGVMPLMARSRQRR